MITIQFVGVLVALAAIHFTYLYYKRTHFSKKELLFWLTIWLAFLTVTIFPRIMSPIVGHLGLQRPMDLIMIIAFVIIFILTFHNYVTNRRIMDKVESLVREIALHDLFADPSNKKRVDVFH